MKRNKTLFLSPLILLPLMVGCELNTSLERPVVTLATPPPPITGGTLLVTSDGELAVVGDPDRDAIHVVDLERRVRTRRLTLPEQSEPGRLVQGDDGRVHVVLRSGGAIASFDPRADGLELTPVCAAPRGLDVDPQGRLFIVCASGELFLWDGSAPEMIAEVGSGARDIVVLGDRLLVSNLRSAEISVLGLDGSPQSTLRPPASGNHTPNTAMRLRRSGDAALLLYQRSRVGRGPTPVLEHGPCPADVPRREFSTEACRTNGVQVVVSEVSPAGVGTGAILSGGAFVVDVDQRGDGLLALASPAEIGGLDRQRTRRVRRARIGSGGCLEDGDAQGFDGQATSVAWTPDGEMVAFSREPAAVWIGDEPIVLDEPSRRDTGHDLFHSASEVLSCASCHVEGGDDGHLWSIGRSTAATRDLRNSTALADRALLEHPVRVSELPNGSAVYLEPAIYLDDARTEALTAWLSTLPPPPAP